MLFAMLAAATSFSTCTPVPGAEKLWESPFTRYVMVGETHGTNEAPELFADLACAASKKRHVMVALEQPPEDQPAIDAFLKSNGDADARVQFLKAGMWNQPMKDGRSSQAMLNLFERLRQLKQEGRIRGAAAFQNYDLSVPFSNANEGMNRGMAALLKRLAAANPDALVLAYGGSVHMSHDNVGDTGIASAAGRLPRAETKSVFIDGEEGSAWVCVNNECAPRPQSPQNLVCRAGIRQVVMLPKDGEPRGFDAVACIGKPLTASPPAVPLPGKRSGDE
jgi:hypothetical protein